MFKENVYVKLKDNTSVFTDMHSGHSIVRKQLGEFAPTEQVRAAIKGGALVKVTKEDFKAYEKAQKADKKEQAPASTDKYKGMTNDELEDELFAKKVDFPVGNTVKKDLLVLLQTDDEGKTKEEDKIVLEEGQYIITHAALKANPDLDAEFNAGDVATHESEEGSEEEE